MSNINIFGDRRVSYHTLGCKLNFAETSAIGKELAKHSFVTAKHGEPVDVCIINTCSVTDVADKKCRATIRKIVRENPSAYIVVTGCYAQLRPDEILGIDGVNLILGSNEKGDLRKYLNLIEEGVQFNSVQISSQPDIVAFQPSWAMGERTRCFLKIQDGCDYKCTYCTIPTARGKSRNGSIDQTIEEARNAVLHGVKEFVLTGVNIGEFKTDRGENFYTLIQELNKIDGVERIRISSIEPNLLTHEIIEFVAHSNKFMPHFHIPLQSGDNEVLRLMKRRYRRELFAEKVKAIKDYIPDAFIGVDLIAGMRGETEDLFTSSMNFVKDLPISQLHVFTYSERANTSALEIKHSNTPQEKQKRSNLLQTLSSEKKHSFYASQQGVIRPVLFESRKKGDIMQGFTDNYIRVETAFNSHLINQISSVELGDFNQDMTALLGIIKT